MKNKRNVFQSFSMVIQFGLNMLVPLVMCTMAGVWLGDKLDIKVMAVPFFIIGALAGFRSIYIMVKKIIKDDKK